MLRVGGMIYDGVRGDVVLAVEDCFYEYEAIGEDSTEEYSDCHHELRSYPRAGGEYYSLSELPEEIRALDYDARSDMLIVSGQTKVMFFDRGQARGDQLLPDGGIDLAGDAPSVLEPTYQFPLVGSFQFCY